MLLTGATGFVGRQVARILAEREIAFSAVVREGADATDLKASSECRSVVSTPDLFAETADWWRAACANVDTVVHLAWYAEPGKYLNSPRNLDCLAGTLQLAKGAIQAGVRRFVGVGTCFEYELGASPLSVDTPLAPRSPYAATKAAAYLALSGLLPASSVEFAWCRLFYLHGEGEDHRRLVPHIRDRLLANEPVALTAGTQVRDYLDVAVAARMLVDVALGGKQGPFNICSGVGISVRQLAESISDEYAGRHLLRFGERAADPLDPPFVVGVPY